MTAPNQKAHRQFEHINAPSLALYQLHPLPQARASRFMRNVYLPIKEEDRENKADKSQVYSFPPERRKQEVTHDKYECRTALF